jgi:hypothetical protein
MFYITDDEMFHSQIEVIISNFNKMCKALYIFDIVLEKTSFSTSNTNI